MSFITLPFATVPLYRAVTNWTTAWRSAITASAEVTAPSEPWKADGFMMHAEEFAFLARAHLDNAVFASDQWHDFLTILSPSDSQRHPDGLSTLDETSMNQVTDLMLNFEALHMQ